MTRNQWIKEYLQVHEHTPKFRTWDNVPTWIIELAVRYDRLKASHGMRTETEFKMHRLCTDLDVSGVKQVSEVWKYMVVREAEDARAMKKRPESKELPILDTAAKRPTASAIVIALLRENPVRTDAQIIAAVNAGTFHDGFNRAQLAWYKGKFKKGELKGQNGVGELIREAAPDNHIKVKVNA